MKAFTTIVYIVIAALVCVFAVSAAAYLSSKDFSSVFEELTFGSDSGLKSGSDNASASDNIYSVNHSDGNSGSASASSDSSENQSGFSVSFSDTMHVVSGGYVYFLTAFKLIGDPDNELLIGYVYVDDNGYHNYVTDTYYTGFTIGGSRNSVADLFGEEYADYNLVIFEYDLSGVNNGVGVLPVVAEVEKASNFNINDASTYTVVKTYKPSETVTDMYVIGG